MPQAQRSDTPGHGKDVDDDELRTKSYTPQESVDSGNMLENQSATVLKTDH